MGDKSGINSQAGFIFQKKIFLLNVVDMQSGEVATFEGLDDVSIDSQRTENEHIAITGSPSKGLVQVKLGNVSDAIMTRIVCNWALATKKCPSINRYEIVVPYGRNVESGILNRAATEVYESIREKSQNKRNRNALYKQLIDGFDENEFAVIFNRIKAHNATTILVEDIDQLLEDKLADVLYKGTEEFSGAFYNQRVEELQKKLFFEIDKTLKERREFIISKECFRDMCNEIVERISANRYDPDYELFAENLDIDQLLGSGGRHIQQLEKCGLEHRDLEDALCEMAYYSAIRNFHLERVNMSRQKAHKNFRNTVLRLQAEKRDNPLLRFVETRQASNDRCSNEQERGGACVYLTRDDVEEKFQITWWDEDVHGSL